MPTSFAAALLVAGALAGSAVAADAPTFLTPSKNIGCIYIPPYEGHPAAYLRCDIGGGLHPLPPRPKSCDLDWGYGYQMSGASGRPRPFCAGDTAKDPKARVLAYGATWHRGPFRCLSQAIGLKCTNTAKHGFFLSRQRSYIF